jgi:hypothetical protein
MSSRDLAKIAYFFSRRDSLNINPATLERVQQAMIDYVVGSSDSKKVNSVLQEISKSFRLPREIKMVNESDLSNYNARMQVTLAFVDKHNLLRDLSKVLDKAAKAQFNEFLKSKDIGEMLSESNPDSIVKALLDDTTAIFLGEKVKKRAKKRETLTKKVENTERTAAGKRISKAVAAARKRLSYEDVVDTTDVDLDGKIPSARQHVNRMMDAYGDREDLQEDEAISLYTKMMLDKMLNEQFGKAVSAKSGDKIQTRNEKGQFGKVQKDLAVSPAMQSMLHLYIRDHMGPGNDKTKLNYQTGRFAISARIVRLIANREKKTMEIVYSYMQYPYSTFAKGGAQYDAGAPKRNPEYIIDRGIKDLLRRRSNLRGYKLVTRLLQ